MVDAALTTPPAQARRSDPFPPGMHRPTPPLFKRYRVAPPQSAGQGAERLAQRGWRAMLWSLGLAAVVTLGALGLARAGVVDFSRNLLSWADRQWGPDAPARLLTWQRIVRDSLVARDAGKLEVPAQLARSNDFFNQVPYRTDRQHWGMEDYWATPVELLGSLGGDCEDYAVAKYLTLKELGVPIERLRITYVRALRLNEAHMVLAYYPTPDADPLILDNLNPVIRPASQRPDLEPVYSFNDDDLWLPNGLTRKGGSSQVRLWKDMLAKMLREQQM